MKNKCLVCKHENSSKNTFCSSCGNKLPQSKVEDKNGFLTFLSYILSVLKAIGNSLLDNLYLILLTVSFSYFIFYKIAINDPEIFAGWAAKNSTLIELKSIAAIILTAGIFTAALKYLQYSKVFEKEFERVIASQKFLNEVKSSVESITLSKKYLLKQSNLDRIWKRVTLCMYEQNFPELYSDIEKKLENDFFLQSTTTYYYRHQKVSYFITKYSDDVVKIEQDLIYTIVRPNDKLFTWDCGFMCLEIDSENGTYPKVEIELIDDVDNVFDPESHIHTEKNGELLSRKVAMNLQGKKEYILKRKLTMLQNLKNDRILSFASDRLIFDLDVIVKHDPTLNVIFSEAYSKNQQFIQEVVRDNNTFSFIHRGLLLPGEKFKLFFLKVDKELL